jgi:hypothetical protein
VLAFFFSKSRFNILLLENIFKECALAAVHEKGNALTSLVVGQVSLTKLHLSRKGQGLPAGIQPDSSPLVLL